MSSPYINTKLFSTVMLHPYQMDNKVYINLKKNLEYNIVKRCLLNYGYIVKIIEILDYKDGIIEAENTESSALFDVAFSCRLCIPLKDMQVIAKIDRINKLLITAVNGPIIIIITNDRINDKIFFKDNNDNMRYKKAAQSVILQQNDFIKITLQSVKFNDGDTKIKAIGFMDDIASEDEIKKFYDDEYDEGETKQVEDI